VAPAGEGDGSARARIFAVSSDDRDLASKVEGIVRFPKKQKQTAREACPRAAAFSQKDENYPAFVCAM